MHGPTMLVILDGFGYSSSSRGNAPQLARMPFWQSFVNKYPNALLHASGKHVGLPDGYIGNSEVGHLTLGAGRVVDSYLKRFNDAIDDGSLFVNSLLIEKFTQLKATGKALHLMGLLSDAGVHSHTKHLFALMHMARDIGIEHVYIHAFLDGRDVEPKSASRYLEALDDEIGACDNAVLATVSGRLYAMDRDTNWDKTWTVYTMLCGLQQSVRAASWHEVLEKNYASAVTDEFIKPTLLDSDGVIKHGDGIIFFNIRPDRACQLTEAFVSNDFLQFKNPMNSAAGTVSFLLSPVTYKASFSNDVLFTREKITHTLLDEIAIQHAPHPPQVFIAAETEKYAHVTYFFRGMEDIQCEHETRMLISSMKVNAYATHPEMSAIQITDAVIASLNAHPAYFYLVNYANPDMVGHSGNLAATVQACEIIDEQLRRLHDEVVAAHGGTLIVTADHGNAEHKLDTQGNPLTAHTTNPVPFVLACKKHDHKTQGFNVPKHGLADVAATVLTCMGLQVPHVMNNTIIF